MPTQVFFKTHEDKIFKSLQILRQYDKQGTCIPLIQSRVDEFKKELTVYSVDKKQIESQFIQFANTLHLVVTKPQHIQFFIGKYINNSNYFPVGVQMKRTPDFSEHRFFSRLCLLGLGLLGASIPVFFLNPIVAGLILAGGITLLILGFMYFLNPNRLNVKEKKEEDCALFNAIGSFMPDAIHTAWDQETKPMRPLYLIN